MSIEEINVKCDELYGKPAPQITNGLSRFYGETGMGSSIRRMLADAQRECDMKVQEAKREGLTKGTIRGVGGTLAAVLILGTTRVIISKVKQAKEKKAVSKMNQQDHNEIINSCEICQQYMKEDYGKVQEAVDRRNIHGKQRFEQSCIDTCGA